MSYRTPREESERTLIAALGHADRSDTLEEIRAARDGLINFPMLNHISKEGKTALHLALIELDRKELIITDGLSAIEQATTGMRRNDTSTAATEALLDQIDTTAAWSEAAAEEPAMLVHSQDVIAFLEQINGDEEKMKAAFHIRNLLDSTKYNIFGYTILQYLRDKSKIVAGGLYEWCEDYYVSIRLPHLLRAGDQRFECAIQIWPDQYYDFYDHTRQIIAIVPLDDTITVDELLHISKAKGIKDMHIYREDDNEWLYYKDAMGIEYFSNKDQFYQTVEDIANRFLALRAAH